jgi:flagellar protein FliS
MSLFEEHALQGASGVDLVVALYDGMIRFLHSAADAVDRHDVTARRIAVKRTLDIVIHLQARLRMDIGGKPAETLSEFYATIFAQILQASQSASRPKFEHVIACVRNVRGAWKQVAHEVNLSAQRRDVSIQGGAGSQTRPETDQDSPVSAHWTA